MALIQTQSLSKKKKIFVDSSVLMAAAISPKGSARDLIKKSLRGEIEVIISDLVNVITPDEIVNHASQDQLLKAQAEAKKKKIRYLEQINI